MVKKEKKCQQKYEKKNKDLKAITFTLLYMLNQKWLFLFL